MNPRIIFMGTTSFSILSIEKILKFQYNIVGVITITDRFSKRYKSIFLESVVKKYARVLALPLLQSDDLKYSFFLDTLKKWHPEILIVVSFRILPEIIWRFFSLGCINLHPSMLPNYKGSSPIHWVIINGENITGVTTFKLSEKIDMGRILLQKKISIEKKENAGCLSLRLSERGASLIIETIKIYNSLSKKEQPINIPFKMAPKLLNFFSKINLKRNVKDVYNNIRGNSPLPGAWCIIANNVFKIYRVEDIVENYYNSIGNIEINKITINEGYLLILECQLGGKLPIIIKDFI